MEGIFVEMDRGGGVFLTHGKRGKRQSCAYCQYSDFFTWAITGEKMLAFAFFNDQNVCRKA